MAEKTGNTEARSYFLNIKGPELLNKYVGETERQIRLIFQRAREKSEEGNPVIVFFDEMDSLFRTRGTGISSDIESTIVPQLLAEIDGVEALKNVIVIGASNREDLIDPAILRPGRLDVKIKIERPDEDSAKQIFAQYLTPNLPIADEETGRHGGPEKAVLAMIDDAVDRMYAVDETNRFLEVTYQNGDKEILFFKDFSSGAMIENIVRRAKKLSIKRQIADGEKGICTQDLLDSIRQEFREHEDLPNTTNPDDWAKISGKKGERIVYVRTILSEGTRSPGRPSDRTRHHRAVPLARRGRVSRSAPSRRRCARPFEGEHALLHGGDELARPQQRQRRHAIAVRMRRDAARQPVVGGRLEGRDHCVADVPTFRIDGRRDVFDGVVEAARRVEQLRSCLVARDDGIFVREPRHAVAGEEQRARQAQQRDPRLAVDLAAVALDRVVLERGDGEIA